jgi:hypothetical protein
MDRRADFWAVFVAPDSLLDPIRGTSGFQRLQREYAKTK